MEELYVCGHPKKEHELVNGAMGLVCMHEEANGEVECDCMDFRQAEAVGA
ncbi:MAG: hypothetical protein NVS9B14_06500 [Candidatus Acidiferrum sp.]